MKKLRDIKVSLGGLNVSSYLNGVILLLSISFIINIKELTK